MFGQFGPRMAPCLCLLALAVSAGAEILTPPYFNLAEGRKITATATCGEDTEGPELYCKLVGPTNAENDVNVNLIQGQHCDVCDPTKPDKSHRPEYAIDGMETWWQSPPLSRGMKYNEVNLTIDLGQEFHVAYVYVRMANSPRPDLWVLEKSVDYGKSFTPWQYFSDSLSDCAQFFGQESLSPITRDDSVVCSTDHSKIVPLEGGEIPISLLNNRPSANHYFNSSILQEWTRATNIRLKLLRTKNLYGHLMSVERQDPTVTRRYFYSIKDISIGGRCMCNGHADTCDKTDMNDPSLLVCICRHNTCGPKCDTCCPGYEQKAWRQSKSSAPFTCEPCNCFNHSRECAYDPEVDRKRMSLDIYGKFEGGGVCQNCQHNTEGINCNKCKDRFYRPYSKSWNETDVCQPCDCDEVYSTGNCAEGSGKCECRKEYHPPDCDACSFGYYGYPICKSCECFLNGTLDLQCEATDGVCPCKTNFAGDNCAICADDYFNFPICQHCECNPLGSLTSACDKVSGNCTCKNNYGGKKCDQCQNGYYDYPSCPYCDCDVKGTVPAICDKASGKCICKEGYAGARCDQCIPGFYGYPDCRPCNCSLTGAASTVCDMTGKCPCLINFAGRTCESCSPGYFKYPECLACNCDSHGSNGVTCNNEGVCQCHHNFDGDHCSSCMDGFYNFPICEECNCNPAGVITAFAGCGSVPKGELCQCKDRVEGRICDKCKPLFWNLNMMNPEGCEDCMCNSAGVLGGLAVCGNEDGQCMCKPSVVERGCTECADGSYNLREDNLFGCSDCGCDVGGSIDPVCNKFSGQCKCQLRIMGRTCKEPLRMHYFPTLYQHQYEVEDGRTQDSDVRYSYNETDFPNYSWKGYAVFNLLQREVLMDIDIEKSSLYRMIFRYVNKNREVVTGTIKIIPEIDSSQNPIYSDIAQKYQVQFKTSFEPAFETMTAIGTTTPVALVMNPGRWTISITIDKNLLLDYFVLLPEEFYTASILNQNVEAPCTIGKKGLCRVFSYPNVSRYDVTLGGGGYIDMGPGAYSTLTEYYNNNDHLNELGIRTRIPLLNENQKDIDYNISLSKPGAYVLVVSYVTPIDDPRTHVVELATDINDYDQIGYDYDKISLYNCPYTTPCRQMAVNPYGVVSVYNTDENLLHLKLKSKDANVGIQSIVAIPYEEWSLDFIQPRPVYISKDGAHVKSTFPNPPESKKIHFKKEALQHEGETKRIVDIYNTSYVYLGPGDKMIDVRSKVQNPGFYTFIVHYYQPESTEYHMDVLIQNGLFYEAKVPLRHCPSISGCRAVVTQKDGNNKFGLTENFMITYTLPDNKDVYLNNMLVVPHELYSQRFLEEDALDRTGDFITTCGNNHFNIDTKQEGFCRDSTFSITAGYNNGSLPCQCDYDGSLSFICESFGGQCPCKPHVIGRQCSSCRTGYYGFPECKPCNCPSSSTCEPTTGQCICPQHVIGEMCDQCEPHTYGFDPFSGCEECKCNPLGVLKDLQCDINNGSCACKENIVGRKCDTCSAGFFAFPYCEQCECELRGTTEEICDQQSAECFCKKLVTGPGCDICMEGTFDLQENNIDGCTECFCFGKTPRCYSSNLLIHYILNMNGWSIAKVNATDRLLVEKIDIKLHKVGDLSFGIDLSEDSLKNETFYFVAPDNYLGKQLTSYGAYLNYTIFYTLGHMGKATLRPDVILEGANNYLVFNGVEQPAPAQDFVNSLEIVESNFVQPNGFPAKRDQLMTVLKELRGIYIRATYWSVSQTSRLSYVVLENGVQSINGTGYYELATSVEHCECPPQYTGLSCEECAPGHYRVNTGPHGGYCVACNCHGHTDECDVTTGVCLNCQHNTIGDHCEQCDIGYHGNALQGTPMDCLICACPQPVASNNFAHACEVSADGEKISCECNEGYEGARCQGCAAGFFGRPEQIGDYCKPCECSGNINPNERGSCDTVTGECLRCMNNTFGQACALCAPGYFGDAVKLKDCQTCVCDDAGTDKCNSYTGECVCKQNVIGDKCEMCEVDHFGFESGQGCEPCACGVASFSTQCDDNSGQCRCKPGVTGRMCDRCAPGFWNYTADGCVTCGCKSEYSLGFGCNAETGQCECLQGVTGDKCDHCPYRWAFVPDYGCHICDSCTHDLLDFTDELAAIIDPVQIEFDSAQSGYFTTRRLIHINDTLKELQPKVLLLSPDQINLKPIIQELDSMEQDSNNMNRKANYSLDNSGKLVKQSDGIYEMTVTILENARDASDDASNTIDDIEQLATNLAEGEGPRIDTALIQAEDILKSIKIFNLTEKEDAADNELDDVIDLLKALEDFKKPVDIVQNNTRGIKNELKLFNERIDDLSNHTQYALAKSAEAKELYDKNGKERLQKKLSNINQQTSETEKNLEDSVVYNRNATKYLSKAQQIFDLIEDQNSLIEEDNNYFNESLEDTSKKLFAIGDLIPEVEQHADELSRRAQELDNLLTETRNTSENAVRAATAYNAIINAITDAQKAADDSEEEVYTTATSLEGIEADAVEAEANSSNLLLDAHEAFKKIKDLTPALETIKNNSRPVRSLHDRNGEQLKNIDKFIQNYQTESLNEVLKTAKDNAEEADIDSQETLKELKRGFKEVANRTDSAKLLPTKVYDTNRDVNQIRKQLETVNEKLPEITKSLDELPSVQSHNQLTDDIEEKIKRLNQQIALARDIASRIEVGVKFNPSTTLELRNPDNLADLSTSTQISGYFRTEKPNGLLFYIGNGKGTNLRRTKSDDYMALEIENGYPVLTLDLGNDAERIINEKYVSDNNWYQFIIDRTGLNAKLTIKEQLADGREKETVSEQQLEGPYSIFNLDKNQSKIFVGSYPLEFKMQDKVVQNSFEGEVEGLMIGETPVSLWNFNRGYENNEGAERRDKLRKIQSTGFRFNGKGYAIMNSRGYQFRGRSDIRLSFKTFASEGLMFLYGKDKTFVSLELRNGKVMYKYNLGGDTKVWHTTRTYNDGDWHTIQASRDGAKGRFIVDQEEVSDDSRPIFGTQIDLDDTMFIGGYPQMHSFKDVTNNDFDGCIDNVVIMRNPVDLSDNIKAYGVIPGCPVKFSRLVSFYGKRQGYIKKANISSPNDFKVNLKFKTQAKDGLIFYATDRNQISGMSLSLQNGYLKLISQNMELTSNENNFNDNEWHVVSIRHNHDALKLDFDDYGYKVTDSPPPSLRILYGDVFIGGLPANYYVASGKIASSVPFAGCIGDATINGTIINFANLTEKYGEEVGKCILDKQIGSDSDIHTVPQLPPLQELEYHATTESEEQTETYYEGEKPTRGDGGKDGGGDDTEEGETDGEVDPETDPDQDVGGSTDEEEEKSPETHVIHETYTEARPEVTTWPTPRPRPKVTTSAPPLCALPMEPLIDDSILQSGSYRYGTEKDSRLEFKSARGKYRKQFDFSLEFKTTHKNGIIFYVADAQHNNFVSLFIKDGYVYYTFNTGSGPAIIKSFETSNDNIWHFVEFSRDGPNGKLVIDENMVAEGKAVGHSQKLEIFPPYYLGGVAPNVFNHVLGNLNLTESFKGCIRNFQMNNKVMENMEKFGVIPCSENVEPGVFFGSRGGHVKLKEKFKVGLEVDVKMDIKPRNVSGLIMAVHGKRDYFVLELDMGSLKLTVDNGKGPISTKYVPPGSQSFCDGQWHSIQAVKSKSVVTLAVNGVYSDPGIGDHRSASTDTGGFLFLGGHRFLQKAKGLTVRIPYVGCIRHVLVNNIPIPITPNMVDGQITIGSCPTN